METTAGRSRLPPSEDGLRVSARCPECGGRSRIETADPCLRCPGCEASHLVLWSGPALPLVLPNRLRDAAEALDAARRGTPLHPEATLARHTFLLAPYWHRSGRVTEAAIGNGPEGERLRAAAAVPAELSARGFCPSLALPETGKLGYVRSFDLAPAGPSHLVPMVRLAGGPELLAEGEARAARMRIVRGVDVLERLGVFVPGPLHLVLRPFHLVAVDTRSGRRHLLLDGASRQLVSELTEAAALRLDAAVVLDRLPVQPTVSFLPMRCPACAAPVALEPAAHVRFCPTCRHALKVNGSSLATVPHRLEVPDGPASRSLFLPFWRFRFALHDPLDGAPLSTLEALAARAGAEPSPLATPFLDVPAFRPSAPRRPAGGVQALFEVARPPLPLAPGPAGSDVPAPARPVALAPSEAAATARAALLLSIPPGTVARASAARLRALVLDAPLRLEAEGLVLRAFGKGDLPASPR